MPDSYSMTPRNPCPACQGTHEFTTADGVPYWDSGAPTIFMVVCPATGKRVEVAVPAAVQTADGRELTDQECPVCKKARFFVSREQPGAGPVVVQYLECSNSGCGYEMMRRFDKLAQRALPV